MAHLKITLLSAAAVLAIGAATLGCKAHDSDPDDADEPEGAARSALQFADRKILDVGRNADGRLEIFAIGMDRAVWHKWQSAPSAGPWSDWSSLGGGLISAPVLGSNADGRIEVFARGLDNGIWHIWQTAPNSGWSAWAPLGGVVESEPAVEQNADGRLEVFARGTDNAVWHLWETAPSAGPWSAWASLGGVIQ